MAAGDVNCHLGLKLLATQRGVDDHRTRDSQRHCAAHGTTAPTGQHQPVSTNSWHALLDPDGIRGEIRRLSSQKLVSRNPLMGSALTADAHEDRRCQRNAPARQPVHHARDQSVQQQVKVPRDHLKGPQDARWRMEEEDEEEEEEEEDDEAEAGGGHGLRPAGGLPDLTNTRNNGNAVAFVPERGGAGGYFDSRAVRRR